MAQPTRRPCSACGAAVVITPGGEVLDAREVLPRQVCPGCHGSGVSGRERMWCLSCRGTGTAGVELDDDELLFALDAHGRARLIAPSQRQPGDALLRPHSSCTAATPERAVDAPARDLIAA